MQIEFPGLIDLQVNGFAGVDFNNPSIAPEDVFRIVQILRKRGVTRFLPTLITSSLEQFAKCAKTLTRIQHPAIIGIHMEGPYISAEDGPRGAHRREQVVKASIDDFKRRQEAANGEIRLLTVAPEVSGIIKLIEYAVASEIRVAIGHTAASPEQIGDAVRAGASLSTHLGNGCPLSLPRHPNCIWEQLANDDLFASLIVDGHHLPQATVKTMIRAKTPKRTFLVSDTLAVAGCAPGIYELDGRKVVLSENGQASPLGKPWLAGSTISLERAVANTVRFTALPIEEVLPMASSQPADYLGIQTLGRVTADWDEFECQLSNLRVHDTSFSGKLSNKLT